MTKFPNGRGRGSALAGPKARSKVFELHPEASPARWESLVADINERARAILDARRRQTVAGTLTGWRRPVLTGTAGLVAAAVAVLLLLPREGREPVETTFAEAMVPWSVAAWMDGSHVPTVEELVQAVEEYAP